MPTHKINDVDLWYEDTGGAGEVILFHHGYTGSHDSWPPIIEKLRDRYRCVMMDARGAGDSSHPADGYALDQYALDVIAMVDALGIDRFTYVGHSMGGGVGYVLGLDYGHRLDRLVLVAPIPSGGVAVVAALRDANRKLWFDRNEDELVRQRVVGAARPESVDEVRAKAGVSRALSVSEGHYEQSWQSMCDFNVTDRLGEISTPTLMIAAAADSLIRANVSDYLLLPNATLHVFNRVGHLIPQDEPDQFAAVLGDFMAHGVVTAATLAERVARPPKTNIG